MVAQHDELWLSGHLHGPARVFLCQAEVMRSKEEKNQEKEHILKYSNKYLSSRKRGLQHLIS